VTVTVTVTVTVPVTVTVTVTVTVNKQRGVVMGKSMMWCCGKCDSPCQLKTVSSDYSPEACPFDAWMEPQWSRVEETEEVKDLRVIEKELRFIANQLKNGFTLNASRAKELYAMCNEIRSIAENLKIFEVHDA
jgi:hypothetical protein